MSEREARVTQPTTDPRVIAALTDENEIAHGEAWDPARGGLGRCAYCDGDWPCRTQQAIDRLLAALRADRPPEPPTPLRPDITATPEEQGRTPGGEPVTFDEAWADLLREFPTRRDATVRAILDKHRAALGASPPPPDLSEAWIVGVVATALRERKVGLDTERHVLTELRAALASQPPSTPREPTDD